MQQEKLTLENLPLLENGIVSTAFDAELKRLVKDCEDRPLDDKPREITLKVKLTPKVDTHGRSPCCDEVEVECEITGKVPVQRSKVYTMKPKHDGSIVFHPDLPEEPDGLTIHDEIEERQRERASR